MSSPNGGHRKQRVLVVDDDSSVRAAHARIVSHLGYEVETASDGVEALAKLVLGVDLVLLDLYMPNLDGFEVTDRIRADPEHGLVPIIIVTGSDKEAWYPRALEVGANDVLAKPINAHELRLRTRWLMELKRAHDGEKATNERLRESVERATNGLREAVRRATDSERRIHSAHLDTIRRLTIAAEFRDKTIGAHLARVGQSAGVLADAAGLSVGKAEAIRQAAPLHDVGMIAVPDDILLRPGPLDEAERTQVRGHTRIGATLLAGSDSEVLQLGATIALHHHERWDGSGYPEGRVGEAIPVEARICGVVDCYDSITMHRPYRRALPQEEALQFIRDGSGRYFDPNLVAAFLMCLSDIEKIRQQHPLT
jgi:putative two-component system response regulator